MRITQGLPNNACHSKIVWTSTLSLAKQILNQQSRLENCLPIVHMCQMLHINYDIQFPLVSRNLLLRGYYLPHAQQPTKIIYYLDSPSPDQFAYHRRPPSPDHIVHRGRSQLPIGDCGYNPQSNRYHNPVHRSHCSKSTFTKNLMFTDFLLQCLPLIVTHQWALLLTIQPPIITPTAHPSIPSTLALPMRFL
jgi:hypothetical protein